ACGGRRTLTQWRASAAPGCWQTPGRRTRPAERDSRSPGTSPARSGSECPCGLPADWVPTTWGESYRSSHRSWWTHPADWRNPPAARTGRNSNATSGRSTNMRICNDFFGSYGGRYVAEMLRTPLDELEAAFLEAVASAEFTRELAETLRDFAGRPTPLLHAANASRELGGARIHLKLEGMAHTGAHKINNAVGQALLARRMGKTRIIAETGAGQHGVATAAVCARLGIPCRVYMGEVDMRRQRPNVFWMERYGAEVVPVTSGSATLKDAVNEALRDWAASFPSTHYLLGSALGPSPYPDMVREFQSVIGRELYGQMKEKAIEPAALIACVGGGSNAIGFFSPFLETSEPELVGVEAGGRGRKTGEHAARMNGRGQAGIAQGYKSLFLADGDG